VATVNFLALVYYMRRRISRLNGREIIAALARIVIASAAMSVVAYVTYRYLAGSFVDKTFVVRLLEAFVPIGTAGLTFLIAAKLLRIDELEKIFAAVSRKLSKR
ncbi:MAG TPA: hypothetical protein VFZ49_05580, partial [Pyrinomonadaceae bacterium]